jgi:ferredoxin
LSTCSHINDVCSDDDAERLNTRASDHPSIPDTLHLIRWEFVTRNLMKSAWKRASLITLSKRMSGVRFNLFATVEVVFSSRSSKQIFPAKGIQRLVRKAPIDNIDNLFTERVGRTWPLWETRVSLSINQLLLHCRCLRCRICESICPNENEIGSFPRPQIGGCPLSTHIRRLILSNNVSPSDCQFVSEIDAISRQLLVNTDIFPSASIGY